MINILMSIKPFKPCAHFNSDLNRIEYVTQHTTTITEYYNDNVDILYNLDGEVVGCNIYDPLNYIKEVEKNRKSENGK